MTTEAKPAGPAMSRRKAAILMAVLGDDISANILRQLTREQALALAQEIMALGTIKPEERHEALGDYLAIAAGPASPYPGGVEYATSMLLSAFGPEHGKHMAERLLQSVNSASTQVERLRNTDPLELAKVVQNEHPQTLALVLGNLDPNKAAKVLSELPEKLRPQAARRLALLDHVSPEVMNRLAGLISAKSTRFGGSSLESLGGVRVVAELLNHADHAAADAILAEITECDPNLSTEIRQLMFVFEDLLNLSKDILQKLLAKADRKILTMALKGCEATLKKHILSAMSQRSAEMIEEDMEALGPVRIKDVHGARQALIATARQMEETGEISLKAGAEEFVE